MEPFTPAFSLTEAQYAQFQRDGFLVLRDFFSPDEVTEIREAFMTMNADGPVPGLSEINPNYRPEDPLSYYPRMMHPHRHPDKPVGPLALRYLLDARVESVLATLFGEEPVAAQSMFYFKPPGARGQDLHQDNFYLRVLPGTCVAAWTAIDDADEENGTLVVVPETGDYPLVCPEKADKSVFFTSEHVPVPEGKQEVPVLLQAGDVLFFNGNVIHGSYPNRSQERFRRAFICHYVPRSSVETSWGYRPLLDFQGQEVTTIAPASGGGPCGTALPPTNPH